MLGFNNFLKEEDGVGVVELVLIIVVLIAVVIIFRDKLKSLVNSIFSTINKNAKSV